MSLHRQTHQDGFTLIELVITVAIVGVLALLAVPLLQVSAQRQKESELRTALRQIREAIDDYHKAVLDKKIEAPADATGYPPDLEILVEGVPDITKPNRPMIYFLRRMPRDPTNPNAELPAAETWATRSYASPPDSPSSGDDVYDVFSKSDGIALNGVPYREF